MHANQLDRARQIQSRYHPCAVVPLDGWMHSEQFTKLNEHYMELVEQEAIARAQEEAKTQARKTTPESHLELGSLRSVYSTIYSRVRPCDVLV